MANIIMESKTVKELREIAKESGLRGVWKLRKAELIDFINTSHAKSVINFIDDEDKTPEPSAQPVPAKIILTIIKNESFEAERDS